MAGGDHRNLVPLKGGPMKGAAAGKVWLVGAGPGDPDLLTVKALRLLQAADVVVHDRLTPPELLVLARPDARMIDVGKRKSRHTLPQDDINHLLVALAQEGLKVVRLKGGDPFVFGRGGEELLALKDAGVAAEVVPGVTSALAAAAGAGVPLTHRGLAQAVTFVTGHAAVKGGEAGEPEIAEPNLDWPVLSRPNHTLVVYMGVTTAGMLASRLIGAGREPSTPVLIVENASRADERRVLTRLAELPKAAAGLDGPALLVIGEVAALAEVEPLIATAAQNPGSLAKRRPA
jgi:uroporphyrin-III C-methyltransferase